MPENVDNDKPIHSEMYCHNCDRHFGVEYDLSIEGAHRITCPHCQHDHLRMIKDGQVTDDRWGSTNPPMYATTAATYTINTSSGTNSPLADNWMELTFNTQNVTSASISYIDTTAITGSTDRAGTTGGEHV